MTPTTWPRSTSCSSGPASRCSWPSTSCCARRSGPAPAGRRARRCARSGASGGRSGGRRRSGSRSSASTRRTSRTATSRRSSPSCGPTTCSTASWPTSTARCSSATTPRPCCTACSGPASRRTCCRRVYAAFIVFLPLSLGLALVFSHRLQLSLFYAAALSINWVLGAATYFLLPALGPIYAFPQWFSRAAAHGGDPPAADAARRPNRLPRGPDERDAAGDRRVRVAARRDELHRAAGGLPARPGPVAEDRALGVARGDARSRRSTSAGTTSSTTSPAWRSA